MSSENNNEIMTVEQVAKEYAEKMEGKMEQSLIDENVQEILATRTRDDAKLTITCHLTYADVEIIFGDMRFTGRANGFYTGLKDEKKKTIKGVINTKDKDKLFRDTSMFTLSYFPAGLHIDFYGGKSLLTGWFNSVGLNIANGQGVGGGKWDKQ